MPTSKRHFLAVSACALITALVVPHATAQDHSPRSLTIVVPFSAGGAADVVARAVGQAMGPLLKQSVVIENKGGGAGLIGVGAVTRSEPDGNTLVLATDGLFSNPALANKAAQDTLAKLVPVANLAEAPLVLAAATSFPASTIPQLVQLAKSQSVPLTYGTPGLGTAHHLAGELLASMAGIKMTNVPYRGTSAGASDLVSGSVDLQFGNLTSIQALVASGKVKVLAVTSPQRFRLRPEAPTIAETFKGYEMMISFGLMAPKGTPASALARLADAAEKALNLPEVRAQIEGAGLVPAYLAPSAYHQLLKRTTAVRNKIIADAGIKAE